MQGPDAVRSGHGEELMLVGVEAACSEPDVLGKINVSGAWVFNITQCSVALIQRWVCRGRKFR
jgi:hypothetical protein